MIYITSRHIMDAIRNSCPYSITGSLNQIVLLSDSKNQLMRFETSDGEQEILCSWWITVAPETTELVWRFIVLGTKVEVNSIEL